MIGAPLRRRPDVSLEPERRASRRLGRLIYLVLLLGFLAYVAWAFVGPVLFLRADGIVASDRFVAGVSYTAKVTSVDVEPGDRVAAGQLLLTLESTDVLNTIAQLTQGLASLQAHEQELNGRLRKAELLLPVAEKRLAEATEASRVVDRADTAGMASSVFRSAVTREAYDAESEKATLIAEIDAVQGELRGLTSSIEELADALARTRASYSGGSVQALQNGIVGPKIPFPGQVVRAGDGLLEVMTGHRYVLAYLPSGRLYAVAPGEEVVVTDGVTVGKGTVERVDIVTDDLPLEFRTAFGYFERRQVMRIAIPPELSFPYLSRVEVASPWGPSHLMAVIRRQLSF